MKLVTFTDVGRDKKTWKAGVPSDMDKPHLPEYSALMRSIRGSGALMSRDIDCDITSSKKREGVVIAGFRTVGHFSWKEKE